MDLGRIELPPLQCECSILPLDYRPNRGRGAGNRTQTTDSRSLRTTTIRHPDIYTKCRGTENRTRATRPPAVRTTSILLPEVLVWRQGRAYHTLYDAPITTSPNTYFLFFRLSLPAFGISPLLILQPTSLIFFHPMCQAP